MSERFTSLGVPPEFFGHAKHFAAVAKQSWGWKQSDIDAAIRFGANYSGKPEEFAEAAHQFAQQAQLPQIEADLAIGWRDAVVDRGIEHMPKMEEPAPAGDPRKRIAEIEEDMRKPRGDSEYWKRAEMRDEYRELLERVGSDAGEYTPAPTGNDSARRAEIEALMKSDRAAYHRTGADKEYLQILQREAGETPDAAPVVENVPTTQATEGNGNEKRD